MEFLKNLSLVLYSSSYTPLLSVLSYLIHQQTNTSMLMILNFSYHSQLWISLITSLTLKALKLTYLTGCLPISCLLILLILTFSSLVYHNNSLNSLILPFIYLTMSYSHLLILLVILVSSLKKNLSFAQHISSISKSCFLNICDLRCIRNTIDQTTACTIALILLSFILKLTIVTLFYSIYLLHKRNRL